MGGLRIIEYELASPAETTMPLARPVPMRFKDFEDSLAKQVVADFAHQARGCAQFVQRQSRVGDRATR